MATLPSYLNISVPDGGMIQPHGLIMPFDENNPLGTRTSYIVHGTVSSESNYTGMSQELKLEADHEDISLPLTDLSDHVIDQDSTEGKLERSQKQAAKKFESMMDGRRRPVHTSGSKVMLAAFHC